MSVTSLAQCELCHLPIEGREEQATLGGATHRFCCAGCLNVFTILFESGSLDARDQSRVFQASMKLGLVAKPATGDETAAAVTASDQRSASEWAEEDRELEIPIQGMWCSSCAWLIERVLKRRPGVRHCLVSFMNDTARVRYSPRYLSRQEILDQIRELGYRPEEPNRSASEDTRRDLLIRLGVASAPAMYMMMFNIILYTGYFSTLDPGLRLFLQELLLGLSIPIVTWCALPIYQRAWGALRNRAANMETLISLGVGSAFLFSLYSTLTRQQQVYYDTASMIVVLVLLGKFLEATARARAVTAVAALGAMLPKKARLRTPAGEEKMVASDHLRPGDQVIVDAGSVSPVDGEVLEGTGAFDESLLTGESRPIQRTVSEIVLGGALCVEGGVVIRTVRIGGETTLSRIAAVVRDAVSTRSASERLADRVSRVFVPLIVAFALAICLRDLYLLKEPLAVGVMQAVSILVVACPCALGMATPLAISAAMGSAARRGILIRNGAVMERARRIDTLVLDKTGTLTTGRIEVCDVLLPSGADLNRSPMSAIMAVEALSQHPAARAIVDWCGSHGFTPLPGVTMEIIPGRGVRGFVGQTQIEVGGREFVGQLSPELDEPGQEAEKSGRTVVVASVDGKVCAVFILRDRLRPGATEAVEDLRSRGIDVWLVSGDAAETTLAMAASLGIKNVVSRALPEEKIARVQELRRSGRIVAMVGDGINDGPALAEADLGVAMGEGTQLALEAADVALLSGDLRRLPYIFQLSTRTLRIIRQNLFWALCYNLVSVPAAAGVYGKELTIGPLFAAGAMLVSSLSVVFNSLRLQDPGQENLL